MLNNGAAQDRANGWTEQRNKGIDCQRSTALFRLPAVTEYSAADLNVSALHISNHYKLTASAADAPVPLNTLPAIKAPLVCAKPHTIFHMKNHVEAICNMITRPKLSDSGPNRKGPKA